MREIFDEIPIYNKLYKSELGYVAMMRYSDYDERARVDFYIDQDVACQLYKGVANVYPDYRQAVNTSSLRRELGMDTPLASVLARLCCAIGQPFRVETWPHPGKIQIRIKAEDAGDVKVFFGAIKEALANTSSSE